MKKILICAGLLVAFASSSFAASSVSLSFDAGNTGKTLFGAKPGETANNTTALISKTSTGVGLGIQLVDSVSGNTGVGYSHVTQHLQGSKAFGTSYDSTAIYTIDVTTIGTVLLAVPNDINTDDFAAWTAM